VTFVLVSRLDRGAGGRPLMFGGKVAFFDICTWRRRGECERRDGAARDCVRWTSSLMLEAF
jgi:hypothetical protein